eukprot:CAMPEP_0170373878 /NCGR_PEP_ID=MMETSP0117_2-20130122/10301_1 /TAXON_ID=400756 /ORGANISM="Durinskia baltica, Strain CSIRO CS-38" /LENGTH=57 /DNA_ID=CAMNT_0010628793 /DNA_START=414 /DNA_END=584 /DNA_ORIENTATION=+
MHRESPQLARAAREPRAGSSGRAPACLPRGEADVEEPQATQNGARGPLRSLRSTEFA